MDRAEAVMDKKEKKVEKSKGRARTVQERAKAWEELNKKILAKQAAAEALEKENWVDDGDEEMEAEKEEEVEEENAPIEEAMVTEDMATDPQSVPLPEPVEDEEEL
jgi:hypothetical protein